MQKLLSPRIGKVFSGLLLRTQRTHHFQVDVSLTYFHVTVQELFCQRNSPVLQSLFPIRGLTKQEPLLVVTFLLCLASSGCALEGCNDLVRAAFIVNFSNT